MSGGFFFENGNLVCRGIRWSPYTSAPSAQVDNMPIESAVVLINPSAAVNVTGFDPALAFATATPHGSMLWLRNKSPTHDVTLKHNMASAAGNRIYTFDGADFVLGPKHQAFLLYDTDENDANPGWWVFA